MKKILIPIIAISVLIIAVVIYFAIPPQLVVSNSIKVPANIDGAFRELSVEKNWGKWWPKNSSSKTDSQLVSGNYRFQLQKVMYNGLAISIQKDNHADSSTIQFLAIGKDSLLLSWTTVLATGNNPLSRLTQYFNAVAIRKKTGRILSAMQGYLKETKNIYGLDVKKEKVATEYMITASKNFVHYPTTAEVYEIIKGIQVYIDAQQAQIESYPMLNIIALDSVTFKAQAAVPIKKEIKGNETYAVKAMFKGGNILTAEVKGDNNTIKTATLNFNQYIADYQRTVMAMPFQLLVTDRSKQTDSSQWITKLFYPVI